MQQLRTFIIQSLLGGLLVVLPLVIFGLLLNWIFTSIADLISPLTQYVLGRYSAPEQVQLLPQAKTDVTIKTIIACGAGSHQIPGLTAALTQFARKAMDDEQSSP